MTCPDCKQEFWSFDHRCNPEVKKCLGHMSSDELNHFYYDELVLTDDEKQWFRDMGIKVDE